MQMSTVRYVLWLLSKKSTTEGIIYGGYNIITISFDLSVSFIHKQVILKTTNMFMG